MISPSVDSQYKKRGMSRGEHYHQSGPIEKSASFSPDLYNGDAKPPINTERLTDGNRSSDEGVTFGLRSSWTKLKPVSASWTKVHTIHCVGLGCLLPTLMCGAANFWVAVRIFKEEPPPTMWDFPIPMAGNFFVLIIVQTFANFVLSGVIQLCDVLNGIVPPLDPGALSWYPKPDSPLFWWMRPTELILPPRDELDKFFIERLLDSILRAGVWILAAEIIFWPLSTIITYSIYGNTGYNSYPQPQWICCVLGAVHATVFMPLWQVSAYTSIGQRLLDGEEAMRRHGDVSASISSPRPKSRYSSYMLFERSSPRVVSAEKGALAL